MNGTATINLEEMVGTIFRVPEPTTRENATESTQATSYAESYKLVQAQIKALEAEADGYKKLLIAELDKNRAEEMQCGAFTVRNKLISSQRFDSTEFKKTHPALYEQFKKESVSIRFTVN